VSVWSAVLTTATPSTTRWEELPVITTTEAPAWLRRSDQATTWARTMLVPGRAVVIDCETIDLPGALGGKVGYSNLLNRPGSWLLGR
jgi:hypothetical protein